MPGSIAKYLMKTYFKIEYLDGRLAAGNQHLKLQINQDYTTNYQRMSF